MGKDAKKKPLKAKQPVAKKGVKKVAKPKALRAALPAPPDLPVAAGPRKRVLRAEARHLAPLEVPAAGDIAVLRRLWETVEARRLAGDATHSHSARLMARGTAKVAQKLGEEAVECVIEATLGNRQPTILESADLLYHLIVLWVDAGIRPEEVWAELVRREGISGIAEKASRPKAILRAAETTKLP
ncbi:phosphoribosyl-ATP diphosphatase [Roseomonas sp. M0104]|uniref:Phosphoribosyl-ATP pyrophosphatase n=1 Tax=Teichococcus coralli TaxID=2545983 RepID=A0A845BF23_9PROT|nr:phosphoribosyl-ATP diphosphatase [Pseudoroseomonas coralli]MXP64716.1 phosphoribosyl-ATP diphosphatase [Pseudoroseomonas coralli]